MLGGYLLLGGCGGAHGFWPCVGFLAWGFVSGGGGGGIGLSLFEPMVLS